MLSKALEMSVFFHRDPILGNMEGCSFPREFKKRVRFFYQENFYWGIRETCKRRLGNGQLPAYGPRWGTWRVGGSFTMDLEIH
jgi:hypothetical protein